MTLATPLSASIGQTAATQVGYVCAMVTLSLRSNVDTTGLSNSQSTEPLALLEVLWPTKQASSL